MTIVRKFLVLLSLWTLVSRGAGAAEPPNIVFILVDDMGAADGECFGSRFYRTPNLNRLATESVRFTQAYAACAVCSPSRAAILTGQSPARLHLTDWIPGEGQRTEGRLRVPDWQQHLPPDSPTLPEMLRPLGYATACIGKWHLGGGPGQSPRERGFDVAVAAGETGQPASYFWPYGKSGDAHRVPGLAEAGGRDGEYLTDRLTDEALHFIDANRSRSFFLYLSHYAVHSPLEGRREFVEEAASRPAADGQGNAVYAAMLRSVDDSVGRILDRLEELRLDRRTIVIFTSDNGGAVHFGRPPATANGALRKGKGFPYEGGLRVPLLVKVPGLTRGGSVCETPVISHDFVPTLLELAGAPAKRPVSDGVSLAALLRGPAPLKRDALFWHYPHYWLGGQVSPYSVARAGDWKLIRFYEDGHDELYNLRDDPEEKTDLAADRTETRRTLARRLDLWLKETGAQMNLPR